MSLIDPAEVESILTDSLLDKDPVNTPPEEFILVDGVLSKFALDKEKLESHRAEVRAMLEQLHDNFWQTRGGGYTFLNLCEDRNGELWTGLHLVCEWLCVLAIGLDLGVFPMPRAVWGSLPGSVPYFTFKDRIPVNGAD